MPILRLSPFSQGASQRSVQRVGELLYVLGVERLGTGRLHSRGAELLHQVPSTKPRLNAVVIVQLPANTNRNSVFFNHPSGQWNVLGDHYIAGIHEIHDHIVGDIGTITDRDQAYQF